MDAPGRAGSLRTCPRCGWEGPDDVRYCPHDGTRLPTRSLLQAPATTLIGDRYEILDQLGSGGMGTVYRGRHIAIGREVAIKVVDARSAKSSSFRRLEREAKAVALIGHENIVDVLDFGFTEDGRGYMVMELLEGETLRQRLEHQGVIPLEATCEILSQVAFALEAAHAAGIVHRDIKPENIFLARMHGRNVFVKVLDFGIACLRGASPLRESTRNRKSSELTGNAMIGTPQYLAPEMATRGTRVDSRADLFALGVTMYEMLCGDPPFEGGSIMETVLHVVREQHLPLSKRARGLDHIDKVDALIAAALVKDPNERIATAREFRAALVDIMHASDRPARRRAERLDSETQTGRRVFSAWISNTHRATVVDLAGSLDRRAELASITDRIASTAVHLKLVGITRVDSTGYVLWVNWLRELVDRGFAVMLHECSPVMMRQAAISPDFFQALTVASFAAPYYCEQCERTKTIVVTSDGFDLSGLPEVECDACGSRMELDDVAHTYTRYMKSGEDEQTRPG